MIQLMNDELVKLKEWLNANKLSLNVNKTHYIIFTPGRSTSTPKQNLYINGTLLKREHTTKFLGVTIDSKLSWQHHIQSIKLKIAKNIGLICKAKKVCRTSSLVTLYYSFIYPYITYCLEVWGSAPKKYLESIHKLQKLCCRIITGCPKRTSSAPLFKTLKILTVYQLHQYRVMLFMFKLYRGNLPKLVSQMFISNAMADISFTRQIHCFRLPLFKTMNACNSIAFKGVKIWNENYKKFNLFCSYHAFKKSVHIYLLSLGYDCGFL